MNRPDHSGLIWASSVLTLALALAGVWAWHHKAAAAVVVGGTLFIAAIVGGVTAATAWAEERAKRADADQRAEALEKVLEKARVETTELRIDRDLKVARHAEFVRRHRNCPTVRTGDPTLAPVVSLPTQRLAPGEPVPVVEVTDSWLEDVISEQMLRPDGGA